jgi:hypothetical protein
LKIFNRKERKEHIEKGIGNTTGFSSLRSLRSLRLNNLGLLELAPPKFRVDHAMAGSNAASGSMSRVICFSFACRANRKS